MLGLGVVASMACQVFSQFLSIRAVVVILSVDGGDPAPLKIPNAL